MLGSPGEGISSSSSSSTGSSGKKVGTGGGGVAPKYTLLLGNLSLNLFFNSKLTLILGLSGRELTTGFLGKELTVTGEVMPNFLGGIITGFESAMTSVIFERRATSPLKSSLSSPKILTIVATDLMSLEVKASPELRIIRPIICTSRLDKESPNLALISATTLISFSPSSLSVFLMTSDNASISPGVMSSEASMTTLARSLRSSVSTFSGSDSIRICDITCTLLLVKRGSILEIISSTF